MQVVVQPTFLGNVEKRGTIGYSRELLTRPHGPSSQPNFVHSGNTPG